MSETPLIWTKLGNIPADELRHEVLWEMFPDKIIFRERYYLDDEMVKESAHVKILTGVSVLGDASL